MDLWRINAIMIAMACNLPCPRVLWFILPETRHPETRLVVQGVRSTNVRFVNNYLEPGIFNRKWNTGNCLGDFFLMMKYNSYFFMYFWVHRITNRFKRCGIVYQRLAFFLVLLEIARSDDVLIQWSLTCSFWPFP